MACRVFPGQFEGVGGHVECVDYEIGSLDGQGDGNAARTRAQVRNPCSAREVETQRSPDQTLGLGARHECAAIRPELETVELLHAGDVLQGLAGGAATHPSGVTLRDRRLEPVAPVDEQPSLIGFQQVGQQELGVRSRVVDAGIAQHGGRPGKFVGDRQRAGLGNHDHRRDQPSTSLRSRSAWSWAASASRISPISPFMIAARLCMVTGMRCSVTRFCGKL